MTKSDKILNKIESTRDTGSLVSLAYKVDAMEKTKQISVSRRDRLLSAISDKLGFPVLLEALDRISARNLF
jgi:hypothetical protein